MSIKTSFEYLLDLLNPNSEIGKEYNAMLMNQYEEREAYVDYQYKLALTHVMEQERQIAAIHNEQEYAHYQEDKKFRENMRLAEEHKKVVPEEHHDEIDLLQKALEAIFAALMKFSLSLAGLQQQWHDSYRQNAVNTLENFLKAGLKNHEGKTLEITEAKQNQLINALIPPPFSLVLKMVPSLKKKLDDDSVHHMVKANDLFSELKFHALLGGDENAPQLTGADLLKAIKANRHVFKSAYQPMHDVETRTTLIQQELALVQQIDKTRGVAALVEKQLEKMDESLNEEFNRKPGFLMAGG